MMAPKPSIAVLLGSHEPDKDDDKEDDGEDGDFDEHGESVMEDYLEACKKDDAKAAWAAFKKLDELAEHARGEDDGEGEEPGEGEGDHEEA